MDISHDSIEKQGFTGRKVGLKNVLRWEDYFPVYYRSDDLMHTQRVYWMVETVGEYAARTLSNFNLDLARVLALVHDDAELVNGDIQRNRKSKMSLEEKEVFEKEEMKAIGILSEKWPSLVSNFVYKDLLYNALRKIGAEIQLVSYLDKVDALCESWHEIYVGNRKFFEGKNGDRPPVRGSDLAHLRSEYGFISRIFASSHPLLAEFKAPDPLKALENGKFHNYGSIQQPTGFTLYDCWKKTVSGEGREEGLLWLITRTESD